MTRYEPLSQFEKNFNIGASGYIGILPSGEANFYDFRQSIIPNPGSYQDIWHSGMITGVPDATRHSHYNNPSVVSQSGWFRVGCNCVPVSGLSGVSSFLSNAQTELGSLVKYAWQTLPDASISNAASTPALSGISGVFNPYIHYTKSPDDMVIKVGFSGIYKTGYRFDLYNKFYRSTGEEVAAGSPVQPPPPTNIPNGIIV